MYQKRIVEKKVLKKKVRIFVNKFLLMVIVYLLGMITVKVNPDLQPKIKEKVYENSFSFTKIRNLYQKYFGKLVPDNSPEKTVAVFGETIQYLRKEEVEGGVKLIVDEHYSVPLIESGLIVYVGEKNGMNTIIVDQVDGVSVTYQNVNLKDYKLYDYLEKGQIVGNVVANELYLFFQKEGEEVSYQEYI